MDNENAILHNQTISKPFEPHLVMPDSNVTSCLAIKVKYDTDTYWLK